jgi:hypothetical protein
MTRNRQTLEKLTDKILVSIKNEHIKYWFSEVTRQIAALWDKSDQLEKEAHRATSIATHADRGFVEVSSQVKAVTENMNQFKKDLTKKIEDINLSIEKNDKERKEEFYSFKEDIKDSLEESSKKQINTIRWLIGIFLTLLGLIATILIKFFVV